MTSKLKPLPIVSEATQTVIDRYRGVWGFVDSRIQRALVRSAILSELQIDRSQCEGQSAEWLADQLQTWEHEVVEMLKEKLMTLAEE